MFIKKYESSKLSAMPFSQFHILNTATSMKEISYRIEVIFSRKDVKELVVYSEDKNLKTDVELT